MIPEDSCECPCMLDTWLITPVAGVVFVPGRPMLSKPQGVSIEIELIRFISIYIKDVWWWSETNSARLAQAIKQTACLIMFVCASQSKHTASSLLQRPKISSALETRAEPQSGQLVPKVRVRQLSNWTMPRRPCRVRRPAGWPAPRRCLARWSFNGKKAQKKT